jgi:excisionase family DNA binding protein
VPLPPLAENSQQQGEVLTLAEAAAYLRVSEDALRALVSEDAIPGQKIGGEWRFLKRALNEWLRYGSRLYREYRRFPPPWMFEFPPLEELMLALEKRLFMRLAASTEESSKPGSKTAVLKHFGVFRDDDDMDQRLAEARAIREAGAR